MEKQDNIGESRTALAILGVLYASPGGKMKRDDLVAFVTALDVENMSDKEWQRFKRICRRRGKWHRSWLYKLFN